MNIKELMENKLFKMLALVIGVILVLIIVIVIVMSLSGGRVSNYQQLENKLISAAKNYYQDNSGNLPATIGTTSEVSDVTLVEGKYIKSMEKLAPKGSTCSGKVIVKNVNNGYFYQAFVNCGDSYNTTVISDYIKSHTSTVSTGTGLYENSGNYIYRGENPNNYIKFADRLYRIVKINSDSTMDIIATEKKDRVVWDDRYNQDRGNSDGINTYSVSRVRDTLLAYVNSSAFSDSERSMLEPHTLCIGKMNEEADVIYGSECSETLENQIIGLLPISSYVYASIDTTCRKPLDGTCQNYNYLTDVEFNWWTLTADSNSTHRVYSVSSESSPYTTRAASASNAREVLRITDNVVYVSGTGTQTDPYVVK